MFSHLFDKNFKNLKVVKGNLFELAKNAEFDVIIQGNNCFNTQGTGIAVMFTVYVLTVFISAFLISKNLNKINTQMKKEKNDSHLDEYSFFFLIGLLALIPFGNLVAAFILIYSNKQK